MKNISLGGTRLNSSQLAYGCWRIAEDPKRPDQVGRPAVLAAYEAGYTLFDHADIYCDGLSEIVFGRVLKEVSGMRRKVLIASKCGIRKPNDPNPGAPCRYDFSADHIVKSCESSLKRLGVQTIDLYQLHRPDWLMDPEEVAEAFSKLLRQGKVREFGVSNFRPSQVLALQSACSVKLVVNQVEISLAQLSAFTDGTLDQCLAENVTPLAWSPLGAGLLADGARSLLPGQKGYKVGKITKALDQIARARGVSRSVVAFAWLLRHPSGIVPIVGSTNPKKIVEAVRATEFELTREEWYSLLTAALPAPLP